MNWTKTGTTIQRWSKSESNGKEGVTPYSLEF